MPSYMGELLFKKCIQKGKVQIWSLGKSPSKTSKFAYKEIWYGNNLLTLTNYTNSYMSKFNVTDALRSEKYSPVL